MSPTAGLARAAILACQAQIMLQLLMPCGAVQDNGKPFSAAQMADIPASIAHFRYYAGWADKIQGKTIPVPPTPFGSFQAYTLHEPIGVCGLITRMPCPLTHKRLIYPVSYSIGLEVIS